MKTLKYANVTDVFMRRIGAIFRHKYSWGIVLVILAVPASISTFFYNKLEQATLFRDRLIAGRYEGSLSGDMGFVAALTAEFSNELDLRHTLKEGESEEIKRFLLRVKDDLDTSSLIGKALIPSRLGDIELLEDKEALVSLLQDGSSLEGLTDEQFGLTTRSEKFPLLPCLESKPRLGLRSFAFIPSPLLDEEDGPVLTKRLKRDLVFSKVAELRLLEDRSILEKHGITQAYFIPASGMLRILSLEARDQVEHYSQHLPSLRSFSDRTYFHQTLESSDLYRQSEPYIDVAGEGIVVTYSVVIANPELKIVGLLGLDRRLTPLRKVWQEMSLGSGAQKDFCVGLYPIDAKTTTIEEECSIPSSVKDLIEANRMSAMSSIRRWSAADRADITFTVPLEGGQLGYFHFDAGQVIGKYRIYLALYVTSLMVVGFMVVQLIYFRSAALNIEKKHGEVERRHAEVVAHLPNGFLIVNEVDLIVEANQKFKDIIGESDSEFVGRSLRDLFTQETLSEYMALVARDESGFDFVGNMKRVNGRSEPVIITGAGLYGGALYSRMLIVIPSRDLEATIASKFLNVFSHALKSPAHSILMISDRFRRKKAQPKFDYYFSLMQKEIHEFSVMVNDVLRFSQLELEDVKPDFKPLNVALLLRSCLSPVRERLSRSGIKFSSNIPEKLRAYVDTDMCLVVFNNLIDNALKYCPSGEIRVDAFEKGEDIIVNFCDTGMGVREEDRELIFERFFRSEDPEVRKKDGLGIGLYISRKYVRLHGGELSYEPLIGRLTVDSFEHNLGSKFTVCIPKRARHYNGKDK